MRRINGMMVRFNRDVTLTAGDVYRIEVDGDGMVEFQRLRKQDAVGREWEVIAQGPEIGLASPPPPWAGVVAYPADPAKIG